MLTRSSKIVVCPKARVRKGRVDKVWKIRGERRRRGWRTGRASTNETLWNHAPKMNSVN